ncbi:unnamed protein product [Sympodiomycopsis kandeliae]
MAPKRPHPGDHGSSSSRKEQRMTQRRDARKIDTQPVTSTTTSTSTNLPPQLDVEQSLSSRKYEILSLIKAMKTARNSSTTRAWQLLPRHARRRAASHNILRLPSRLRRKGLAELKASTTEPKTRSQTRKRLANHPKSKSLARKEELMTRASRPDAKWLESHLYYAKRFRMSRAEFDGNRWGYVMPEEPSMKGSRTDWRAFHQGCAVFDSSWDQWVRISVKVPKPNPTTSEDPMQCEQDVGTPHDPAGILRNLLISAGITCSSPALVPNTAFDTTLHSGNPGPSNRIQCPVTVYVIGKATQPQTSAGAVSPAAPQPSSTHSRHLRKTLALLPSPPPLSELYPDFQVLLRTHTAAIKQLQSSLKRATQKHPAPKGVHIVVTTLKGPDAATLVGNERVSGKGKEKQKEDDHHHLSTHAQRTIQSRMVALQRQDLRSRAYNVFELYGPTTGSVLGGVLQPVASTSAEVRKYWDAITTSTTAVVTAAHSDAPRPIVHLRVHDPRLGHPYRKRKINKTASPPDLASLQTTPCLFNDGMSSPRFTKGDLDKRRSNQLLPGSKLTPDSQDDVVPITLIPRLGAPAGYTLLVPQCWSRPFLYSLLSTSVRPLSLSGMKHLHLDSGIPCYPNDFIGSPGWKEDVDFQFKKLQLSWLRRPPAKRLNFEKLGIQWPFGGSMMWVQLAKNAKRVLSDNLQCEYKDGTSGEGGVHLTGSKSVVMQQSQVIYQLLLNRQQRPQEQTAVPQETTVVPQGPTAVPQETSSVPRLLSHIISPNQSTTSSPFILLHLEPISKGTLSPLSELHIPTSFEELLKPLSEMNTIHVGSITSGNFSLSLGKAVAMGSISQWAWILLTAWNQMAGKKEEVELLVRQINAGHEVRVVKASPVVL